MNERTPYLREVMDAVSDPTVREITVKKAAQVGVSECVFNALGYILDQDPGPTLFVYPTEMAVKKQVRGRLGAFLEASPVLSKIPKKIRLSELEISFDRMPLYLAGANSPTGLASNPCRYFFAEEVDKWPAWTGAREADPLSLGRERTKNFWNRKILKISTPTTRAGYVQAEWERSDRRHYWLPCPHCGEFQVLVFDQVKFGEDGTNEERAEGAYYQCLYCPDPIYDAHKPGMLLEGVWAPEGCEVLKNGEISPPPKAAEHRGYHISALYSPWLKFQTVAQKFLDTKDEPPELMNFKNSWLGEVWEEKEQETDVGLILSKETEVPGFKVPAEVVVLVAGVDVGKHDIHWVVHGYGTEGRCWVVAYGILEKLEDVEPVLLLGSFPREEGNEQLQIARTAIDSGYRTDEVYELCRRFQDRAIPVKGNDRLQGGLPLRSVQRVDRTAEGAPHPLAVRLWHVDTTHYKDQLARMVRTTAGAPGAWHVHSEPAKEFCRHLCSEHKVIERNRSTGVETPRWVRRPGGGANHWLDATVYAMAAADAIQVWCLKDAPSGGDPGPTPAAREPNPFVSRRRIEPGPSRGGWVRGRRRGR